MCHHWNGTGSPTQAKFYTPSAFQDHNKDQICTSCHSHDKDFLGACNGCHGSTSTGQYWPDGLNGSPAYADKNAGAHDNHVLAISQYKYSQDIAQLLADTDRDNRQKAICSFCHPNPGGSGHTADNTGLSGRVDVAGAGQFRKFIGSGLDNVDAASGGYAYDNLSCSNLACHNQVKTPEGANHWNAPSAPNCTTLCHPSSAQTQRHNVHTVSPRSSGSAGGARRGARSGRPSTDGSPRAPRRRGTAARARNRAGCAGPAPARRGPPSRRAPPRARGRARGADRLAVLLPHVDDLDPRERPVLDAPDRETLLDWLQTRPMQHHDAGLGVTMLHAGLPPQWDLATARACAAELESALRCERAGELFARMYGDTPDLWSADHAGWDRLRFTTNCLTRLRAVDAGGRHTP